MLISAVLVREEAAALTSTVAGISPVRALLVVNLYQVSPQSLIYVLSVSLFCVFCPLEVWRSVPACPLL